MKIMFQVFAKKLFGVHYERLGNMLVIEFVIFLGLYYSGFRVKISSEVLYLMSSLFTAGVMWQALSSKDNAENMMNMYMLPLQKKTFLFSYLFALGIYTWFTKTGVLFAVLCAVSPWNVTILLGSSICVSNAIVMTACIYSWRKHWKAGAVWAAVSLVMVCRGSDWIFFLPVVAGNFCMAVLLLGQTDEYSFFNRENQHKSAMQLKNRYSVCRYLCRYLMGHKNYLMNTVVMWGVSFGLPIFLRQMQSTFFLPMGFALLSFHTPICILISCDPELGQAISFLPGQKKMFFAPYCLFIFSCNMMADVLYLFSWQIQVGGVNIGFLLEAIVLALISAVGSVLLEMFYPIRNWKIESDLWHHPRKYVVPVFLMLLAGMMLL